MSSLSRQEVEVGDGAPSEELEQYLTTEGKGTEAECFRMETGVNEF